MKRITYFIVTLALLVLCGYVNAYPVANDIYIEEWCHMNNVVTGTLDYSGGTLGIYELSSVGDVVLSTQDGLFDFIPIDGYVGPASFTYSVTDGEDVAYGTVSMAIFNTLPTAENSSFTIQKNTTLNESVIFYDNIDIDGSLDFVMSMLHYNPEHGEIAFYEDGHFEYTPDIDFIGQDSFTYAVWDGQYDYVFDTSGNVIDKTQVIVEGTVFIDVIPEPATLLLVSIGAVMIRRHK